MRRGREGERDLGHSRLYPVKFVVAHEMGTKRSVSHPLFFLSLSLLAISLCFIGRGRKRGHTVLDLLSVYGMHANMLCNFQWFSYIARVWLTMSEVYTWNSGSREHVAKCGSGVNVW